MLRCSLLLCCFLSSPLWALDHVERLLPRAGQSVDVWNGDLTLKLGSTRPEVLRDAQMITVQGENIPTLHFLLEEQRFSIPGVASTQKPQFFDEHGVLRLVYRGAQLAGSIEKDARLELVKLDEGHCQLSWKLSVIHRGEKLRQQEGSMAYDCQEPRKKQAQNLIPRTQLLPAVSASPAP